MHGIPSKQPCLIQPPPFLKPPRLPSLGAQGIHDSLQVAALSMGILPLQRLSAIHLDSFAAMTGAVPISSCREAGSIDHGDEPSSWKAHLGLLGGVRHKVRNN